MLRTLKNWCRALASLAGGMAVTWKEFLRKNITLQYPEQRMAMHARFRGRVHMPLDPVTGAGKCTACMLCQKACPNFSIEVRAGKNMQGKRVLDQYIYRLATCTQCSLCVEACPFDAICMSREYELSVHDRRQLTLVLNWPEGRAVPSAGAGGRPVATTLAAPVDGQGGQGDAA